MDETTVLTKSRAQDRKEKRTVWFRQFRAQRYLHFMLLPAVIMCFIFQYLNLYGILAAFKNFSVFKGVLGSPWARSNGLEHFIDFFTGPNVWPVMRNTLAVALLKLAFLQFPPVIFAVLLNEINNRIFKRITTTIAYLPHFVSWIIIGGIMMLIFLPTRDAPLNQALLSLGLVDKPTDIINNPNNIWAVFVISHFWKEVGWGSILYMAVITSIDPNLYEAIEIDGGGRLAKMVHITWPALKGTFMILFILSCGRIMSGLGDTFNQSYILGTASNKSMAQVLDVYILRVGLEQARYSFATAVGLFKAVINLMLLITANTLSRRLTGKGLF